MTVRTKSLVFAVNLSLLMWVGIIGGSTWILRQFDTAIDRAVTASVR